MKRKGGNSCEIDARLAQAAKTSLKTKSISAVLREELRLSILSRRHANGQEELDVEFKKPEKHALTPYEIEKKSRRREQNRRAARRCREKKKHNQEGTFMSLAQMMEENKSLEVEIDLLKSQKKAIQDFLSSHEVCLSLKQELKEAPHSECAGSASSLLCDFPASSCEAIPAAQPSVSQVASPSESFDQSIAYALSQDHADNLPQLLVDFCLEHSSPEEELFYGNSADMRRQTVSVSSVSSDVDMFGLESDSDTTFTNDNSGLSDISEDEDVFQTDVPWSLTDCQSSPLLNNNQTYLPLALFDPMTSRDCISACAESSYVKYLNFAEP